MKRSIPILPTVVVLVAVAIMIGLGLWQIDRMHQKEAMLARFAAAQASATQVPFPSARQEEVEAALYRRSEVECRFTSGEWESIAGRNRMGEAGYVHVILCGTQGDRTAYVQAGWSRDVLAPEWKGGKVTGIVAPFHKGGAPRLIADPPLAGLQPNATPDPRDIPNNHFAYAIQWFAFAAVALVIYVLALRKRSRG